MQYFANHGVKAEGMTHNEIIHAAISKKEKKIQHIRIRQQTVSNIYDYDCGSNFCF